MTAGRPPSRTTSTSRPSARSSSAVACALASTWAWSKASRLTLGMRVRASRSARRPGMRSATVALRAETWSGLSTSSVTAGSLTGASSDDSGEGAVAAYSGHVFGRQKTLNEQQTSTLARTPREGAKNRPTPKRRDQEAARKRPLVVADRKEAKNLDRAKRREAALLQRQAMA